MNYRDMWANGIVNLNIYYKFVKEISDFFLNNFVKMGISKKPSTTKVCLNTPKNMEICKKGYANLRKVTKLASTKLQAYIFNYDRCLTVLNEIRSNMFCISCDVASKSFINTDKKELTIRKDQMRKIVESCWEYPLFDFKYMAPVHKAYFDYTTIIVQGAD